MSDILEKSIKELILKKFGPQKGGQIINIVKEGLEEKPVSEDEIKERLIDEVPGMSEEVAFRIIILTIFEPPAKKKI